MERYVFDACSVIAFFEKESGFEKVKELLEKANNGGCIITMNKLNVLEIYYGLYREDSKEVAELFLQP
jgi:PIN domain nuclease of toxin-antitoxin system